METNPIYTLQNTLLHIIDTAASSDKMSNFAYDCLESITNFLLTGKWDVRMLQQQRQGQNMLVTRPQHFDYTKQHPYLANHSLEVERVENRLSGFMVKESLAWKTISQLYGNDVKQVHLRAIAEDIASKHGIHLDRDAKRRKTVLIKWFEENWDKVSPYLHEYKINEDSIEHNSPIAPIMIPTTMPHM